MWVTTERSYRLIQTPFKSANKNLTNIAGEHYAIGQKPKFNVFLPLIITFFDNAPVVGQSSYPPFDFFFQPPTRPDISLPSAATKVK